MTKNFLVTFQFNINTQNEIFKLWVPMPLTAHYQQVELLKNENNSNSSQFAQDPVFGANYFFAKWLSEKDQALVRLETKVAITKRAGGDKQVATLEEQDLYLQARMHVPLDGIVEETAKNITQGIEQPLKKARAIYDWVCDHSQRDPHQVGCGLGNVKEALQDQHICGRCADVTTVFVALMRAAGIPAREIFGVRLKANGTISESQHCRCEFYVEGEGWIPCDPADVSKTCLDENLELTSPRYLEVRDKFFGTWEPNCLAFNSARSFQLVPSTGAYENYLMYPIGISLEERSNPYAPKEFVFELSSIEL